VEELRDDEAVLVGDVDARIRNAGEEGVLASDLIVQNSVAADRLRVDVGEQAIGDALLLAELGKRLLVVVGDRIELDPRGPELRESVAQLTELRPTRGSPHRRSVEHHDRLCPTPARVVVDEAPVSVGQREVGQPLANLGAGRVSVGQAGASRVSERSRCIEAVVVPFDRHGCSIR
jgi:hypothetical protein